MHKSKGISGILLKLEIKEFAEPVYLDAPDYSYSVHLEQILEELRTNKPSSQLLNMIQASQSLFEAGLGSTLKSHKLVTDYKSFEFTDVNKNTTIKIKANQDLKSLSEFLQKSMQQQPELNMRIDFNLALTAKSFESWWMALGSEIKKSIEFIEDPFAWSPTEWSSSLGMGAPLANDFAIDDRMLLELVEPQHYFRHLIIKPYSHLNLDVLAKALDKGMSLVFTHGMETFLGRSIAAKMAERYANKDVIHGLEANKLFVNDFASLEQIKALPWKTANEHL